MIVKETIVTQMTITREYPIVAYPNDMLSY